MYNKNKIYNLSSSTNIQELLNNSIYDDLTMNDWKILMLETYGTIINSVLFKVINHKIKQYDISQNVNSFIYNNKEYWLDKATRVGLMNLINCSKDNIQLVLGDEILELDLDKARNFLAELEVYASKCYVNTQKHLNATKKLLQIEDIINYDYTTGYPEKIILNV